MISYDYLLSDISTIKGIGTKIGKLFRKKNIHTIFDLLWNLPRDFVDRSNVYPVKELQVGKYLTKLGTYFQTRLLEIGEKTKVNITVNGIPALTFFAFNYDDGKYIKTLFIQKMLERNIIAKNALYLSYAHTQEDIDYYLENIKDIFGELSELIRNKEVKSSLKSDVVHCGFYRLA